MALITDAVHAAGLEDGDYTHSAGARLLVKYGKITMENGTLAGSTLTMNTAVKNAIQTLGLLPHHAAQLSSLTPAFVLGLNQSKGSIEIGKDADIVIMDKSFQVLYTICQGNIIYKNRTIE